MQLTQFCKLIEPYILSWDFIIIHNLSKVRNITAGTFNILKYVTWPNVVRLELISKKVKSIPAL